MEVHEADLPEAEDSGARTDSAQIDVLLDAVVPVSVSIGQTEMKIAELMRLGPGAVVTLDKQIGEPLDLYLRGRRFAVGELVLVGDQLGVRVTKVLPSE